MGFLSILLLVVAPLYAEPGSSSDFQIWNYYRVLKKRSHSFSFATDCEFRFEDGGEHLYYYYIQPYLIWIFKGHLEISPSYRQGWRRILRRRQQWITEAVPMLDLTPHFIRGAVCIEDRNRFSYIFPFSRSLSDRFLYRNRLQVAYRCESRHYYLSPFISDEIFIEDFERFVENRFRIGVFIQKRSCIELQLFYQLRHLVQRHDHALGLYLGLYV